VVRGVRECLNSVVAPISVFLNHILVRLHLGFLSHLLLVSRYEVIGALTVDPAELALFEVVDTFIILGVFSILVMTVRCRL